MNVYVNMNMKTNDKVRRVIEILRATGRDGVEKVIDYLLSSSYFTRDCYGHHKERGSKTKGTTGGLVAHSLEVYDYMREHAVGLPADSIAVAALFHDLGKTRASDGRGHGRRSLDILDECGFTLTADERTAIGTHHKHYHTYVTCPLRRLLSDGDCDSTGRWKRAHHR